MMTEVGYNEDGGGGASIINLASAECVGNASSGNSTYSFANIPQTKNCVYAVLYGSSFTKGNTYDLTAMGVYPLVTVAVDESGNCQTSITAAGTNGSASISGDTLTITGQQSGKSNIGLFLLAE